MRGVAESSTEADPEVAVISGIAEVDKVQRTKVAPF